MAKEYQRVDKDYRVLKMFVTRRGPVLEDPQGCWGGTFTPEICCSELTCS